MLGLLVFAGFCAFSASLKPMVRVSCEKPGDWRFETTERAGEPGVRLVTVRGVVPQASPVPRFTVDFEIPAIDCEFIWNPNFGCAENLAMLPWWGDVFNIARTQPVRTFFNRANENRFTLAVGELRRTVKFGGGFDERRFSRHTAVAFFDEPSEPLREYAVEFRLDTRAVPFAAAVRAAAAWQTALAGPAAVPPAAAYDALYSTWYNFHKDVNAAKIEAECANAAKLGMKVVVLDDGWQCDDTEGGYASCGDWEISTTRFPDMRAHVAKVHEMGLKYVVWFSMPFVGENTKAYARFKGKMLRKIPGLGCWVLDPRFPEVRAHLRDIYLARLRAWDIDGFKLDFIDSFGMEGEVDPAVAQDYAGRDCRSIPDGVERLIKEVTSALEAEKRGLLFEFRQAYVGPEIRKYGNMMRVGDCPGSALRNRVHIANLRLLCEGSAVHADMLRWNDAATVQEAQWNILNCLFGVIQYSIVLEKASPEMRAMVKKWIAFADAHRETLLKGRITPHRPELNYPIIESESETERIVVVYDSSVRVNLAPTEKKTLVIDATTGTITE